MVERLHTATLIRTMVKCLNPKIGETVYDGACGSAGFLCEAYEYLRQGDLVWHSLINST